VDRPRATKSAGMKRKPAAINPAPASAAGDGAGAAAYEQEECALSPHQKARHAEEDSK
jgi:hypothetical protein